MINNVQYDRLDYSDSQPVMWQVAIQPEHVNFDPLGGSAPENSVNVQQAARQQAETGNTTASTIGNRSGTNKQTQSDTTIAQTYTPPQIGGTTVGDTLRSLQEQQGGLVQVPTITNIGKPVNMPTIGDGTTADVDPGMVIPNDSDNSETAKKLNNGTITFAAGPQ